jgi:CRISPR-associated endonuclease/helicase Cas3
MEAGGTDSEKTSYSSYWGKAERMTDTCYSWHPLVFHCLDVAAVIKILVEGEHHFASRWARSTGLSMEQITFLVVYSFMLHDIGKFSTTFQSLVPELFKINFPTMELRTYSKRHDTLGFLFWRDNKDSLADTIGLSTIAFLDLVIRAAFGHHGMPPEESDRTSSLPLQSKSFFTEGNRNATTAFMHDCLKLISVPRFPDGTKEFRKALRMITWEIAGVGTLADWIGSDTTFFPYAIENIPLHIYWKKYALQRARSAVCHVGWNICIPHRFQGIRFLFPFIDTPTPLQVEVASLPLLSGPQLFILEDVTGSGKTEAALTLAARMMAEGLANGVYVALPTMATANAMFSRMGDAYRKLYADSAHPSLILAHGARQLSPEFRQMEKNFSSNIVGSLLQKASIVSKADEKFHDELSGPECNSWYADNRKKALLADVGVGTLDQALLAVLPVRHQSLRYVGLQQKILIVDEVHAYDAYMNQLLKNLLAAHAAQGGSVILLSATIPVEKRIELEQAFFEGVSKRKADFSQCQELAFPLVTQVNCSDIESYPVASRVEVARSIQVVIFNEYTEILEFVMHAAHEGKCICWIRNTVGDARRAFTDLLVAGIPREKIDLFHSRFAMIDRLSIEEKTKRNFGKDSGTRERAGRILIATQVVEQSLDLDFDEMVSDIAPIDLLIQRAGRLHRHTRTREGTRQENKGNRDERGIPILHVFGPVFSKDPDSNWLSGIFAGTAAIYADIGKLWLTEKILIDRGKWTMPDDARELIEYVYGKENGSLVPKGILRQSQEALGESLAKAGTGDLNGLCLDRGYCRQAVKVDLWNEDDKVPTRLTADNQEVVLAVMDKENLVPYAISADFPWDMSMLSISKANWERTSYVVPQEYAEKIEELKQKFSRLKYAEFVIVSMRSDGKQIYEEKISDVYDARMGWGRDEDRRS